MIKRLGIIGLLSMALVTASANALAPTQARNARITDGNRSSVNAHVSAAGCWGSNWDEYYWSAFGHDIGWVRINQDGWCGNGHSVTRDFGWWPQTWVWGPYCMTNQSFHAGWDVYPSWKHGGIEASIGVSYPWGCGALRTGNAVIRIAGNGHEDTYNDIF